MPEAYPGFKARLYVDVASTWTHVKSDDVSVNNAKGEIDVSQRGSSFRQKLGGLKDFEISGSFFKDHTDAGQTALKDAYNNDTVVEVLVLDQDNATAGAEGYRCSVTVRDWNETQPLEEGVKIAYVLQNDPTDDPTPVTAPVTVAATVAESNDPPETVEVAETEQAEPDEGAADQA